jgi:hypothetical protein
LGYVVIASMVELCVLICLIDTVLHVS